MPPKQIPGPAAQTQTVRGTLDATPCPHCGKQNDLRHMQEQQLLDTGHKFFCDYCGSSMEVTSIRPVTIVTVRKDPSGKRAQQRPGQRPQPQQQQLQQPGLGGALRRLLGGPKR